MSPTLTIVAGIAGLGVLIALWQVFAPGPRRRRALKRARARLATGDWVDAVERIRKLRNRGAPSAAWQKRFNQAEAEALHVAAAALLKEKRFEDALEQSLRAASLLGKSDLEARLNVQSAMLEEVRRLFAQPPTPASSPPASRGMLNELFASPNAGASRDGDAALHDLIGRILLIQSPCREASFWQALTFLRAGDVNRAMDSLQTARTGESKSLPIDEKLGDLSTADAVASTPATFIDPPLYLGALLLRQGQAKESLRYLTEANRIDANCAIVTLQLGAAMVAAGGDTTLAARALQRALGSRGLSQWEGNPRQAWIEAFPEGRSFVRKLATSHPFTCPVWGGDLGQLIREGRVALGQALYKLGSFQEAADLYSAAIKEGAPSLSIIRGLGLSLARLGKYDEAFKHLRIAHEMENPKDRVTAGYLALCGARGTPTQVDGKARNISWAISVVTQFTAPGDQEWTTLISNLFQEARAEKLPLSLDDQLYLCEHLWSVTATDPAAGQAFHHLMATHPSAVRPEYAWLFCRAVQQLPAAFTSDPPEAMLALFAQTFSHRNDAQEFYAQMRWSLPEVELAYLEHAARIAPGQFPEALGADYAPRGEHVLVEHSLAQEKSGKLDAAMATADVLAKLAPRNTAALDRSAALHYRQGKLDRCTEILESWHAVHPDDPLPLVRLGILLHQQHKLVDCQDRLRAAMDLCQGPKRARIALLGARLTLQSLLARAPDAVTEIPAVRFTVAQHFLEECLRNDPAHSDARWLLAAVRWMRGDADGLAGLSAAFPRADADDSRDQFFAALAHLAAGDAKGAVEVAARGAAAAPVLVENDTGSDRTTQIHWPTEFAYLLGLAHMQSNALGDARETLTKPALAKDSPSSRHAQAFMGLMGFDAAAYEDAVRWWQQIDPKQRAEWKLVEPLAGAVFLEALAAYKDSRFEEAAENLRAAGRLGHRDRRLGALMVQALFKAGQTAIHEVASI